jgi:hypothetical protein
VPLDEKIAERRYTWKKLQKNTAILLRKLFVSEKKIKVYPLISDLDKNILGKYNVEHLKNIKLFNESNKTI